MHIEEQDHRKPGGGWIYFFGCDGFVKIGYAQDVVSRFCNAQTCCPHVMSLLSMFPVSDMVGMEKSLHGLFRDYQHRGEWFRLPNEVLSLIVLLGAEFKSSVSHSPRRPIIKPSS